MNQAEKKTHEREPMKFDTAFTTRDEFRSPFFLATKKRNDDNWSDVKRGVTVFYYSENNYDVIINFYFKPVKQFAMPTQ